MLYDGGMSSIRLLRTFSAVAAEGSFAAAAPRVALTQAAVGQQMRALESELRRPLFERQGKAVVLNDAGRALVPQVRRLLALYDQLLTPAPAEGGMVGGPIRDRRRAGSVAARWGCGGAACPAAGRPPAW